jgi:hypothetical protein
MRSGSIFRLALFVFLVTIAGFGQTAPDPWLILAGGEAGSINAHTTREDLVRAYGASNVIDQKVDVGEGDTEIATVVFPNDAQRTIRILWKDPDKKTEPSSATISGKASRWHAVHGISLGTTLGELQRLNGRPFPVAGYGTDQPGAILSWKGGLLARELQGDGLVILRLDYTPSKGVPQPDLSLINGNCDEPVLQKLNLYVREINWEFPSRFEP